MGILGWLLCVVLILVVLLAILVIGFLAVADILFQSNLPEKPQADDDNFKYSDGNTLFKHFPNLRNECAWSKIGDFPTPVHKLTFKCPKTGADRILYLKREDMASKIYGGNKVRTMEYQFICGKHRAEKTGGSWYSCGGLGSNQAVITAILCEKYNIPVQQFITSDEDSSWDNSYNYISQMSIIRNSITITKNVFTIMYNLYFNTLSSDIKIFAGGNSALGQLGQIGGFFELCDSVNNEEMEAPTDLITPVGSTCTITGLILGYCFAKEINILPKSMENITIRGVIVHHLFAKLPFISRHMINHLGSWSIQLFVKEFGFPDITEQFIDYVNNRLVLEDKYAGQYGGPLPEALEAKEIAEAGKIEPPEAPYPWFCCCFSSKALCHVMNNPDLEKPIFWCTKSLVQPFHSEERYEEQWNLLSEKTKQWLKDGEWEGMDDFKIKQDVFTKVYEKKPYAPEEEKKER